LKYGNIKKDNYEIIIKANDTDDFSQLSVINGLNPRNGGTHINYILDKIIPPIREKLSKKFKTIKPADIKNKIKIMVFARFVPALEFTSQEKIEISNPKSTWDELFKNVKWDKIVKDLLKDEDLILNITEYFTLKEQAKENAELKKLSKTTKKIKSEKYYPAIKNKKYLFIAEGESALGGLQPSLGRDEVGYYELKGVPLNAWEISVAKLNTNKELSELYKIIKNENYEKIVIAADADSDGHHITGLLVGFFVKFLPEYLNKLYRFETPIIGIKKGKKLVKWLYDLKDEKSLILEKSEKAKYYKGFGSWNEKDLEYVIEQDGLERMIVQFTNIDKKLLDDWLSSSKSDTRKKYIKEYELNINII